MAKVTSKLQVTIPKRIAERFGISPGDNIEFVAAGDSISIRPAGRHPAVNLSPAERLRLFRAGTVRQKARNEALSASGTADGSRGWTREELYDRAKPR
jgi:AbrB family looped-hinge helix DNA binding protein